MSVQLTKRIKDPLLEGGGSSFKWTPKELGELCDLDNKSPDPENK